MIRIFCVGEAISIPLLRGTMKASKHPLPRAVLGRIVRDEAAHGVFGWVFLDWALPQIHDERDRAHLLATANDAVVHVQKLWAGLKKKGPQKGGCELDVWAWAETPAYLAAAEKSLQRNVLAPLRARNIPVTVRAPAP